MPLTGGSVDELDPADDDPDDPRYSQPDLCDCSWWTIETIRFVEAVSDSMDSEGD